MKYFLDASVLVAHTGAAGPHVYARVTQSVWHAGSIWATLVNGLPCQKWKFCLVRQKKVHLHKWKDQWSAHVGNSACWRSKAGRRSSSVAHVCSITLVSDPVCHWLLSHTAFSGCTWSASVYSTRSAGTVKPFHSGSHSAALVCRHSSMQQRRNTASLHVQDFFL